MRMERAAWCFVAPALIAIAVFFLLPALAAFVAFVADWRKQAGKKKS